MCVKEEKPNVRYPSDMTDQEWEVIEPIINEVETYKTGRPRDVDLREILNAIFYLNKTGCPWRYLPKDFPDYTLVNYYYNKWKENGLFYKINIKLVQIRRKKAGRNPDPTAAIIDSQSVKGTPESYEDSGFDGNKKVKGRKRHIVVDVIGCLLAVYVSAANVADSTAARDVLILLFAVVKTVQRIWADQGYIGEALFNWLLKTFGCFLEIVKKEENQKGFKLLPRRWVVERTFAWLDRSRRLSKDDERTTTSHESQVYIA
ncbi:MAG: IS5 family transposase, partial [Lamprobacter sp.]|uniref:IS5 family transposase n=1 Tax=Lamprobacter sp. TaxID=3100796 RepID=UPI002B257979